jgi:hypothetical protein
MLLLRQQGERKYFPQNFTQGGTTCELRIYI